MSRAWMLEDSLRVRSGWTACAPTTRGAPVRSLRNTYVGQRECSVTPTAHTLPMVKTFH